MVYGRGRVRGVQNNGVYGEVDLLAKGRRVIRGVEGGNEEEPVQALLSWNFSDGSESSESRAVDASQMSD